MLSRPEYSVSLNNESTFAQLFRQHFNASVMNVSWPLGI